MAKFNIISRNYNTSKFEVALIDNEILDNKYRYILDELYIINDIENGYNEYVTSFKTRVIISNINGERHIKTVKNRNTEDNLSNLPIKNLGCLYQIKLYFIRLFA